jgi:hypothetical protein
MPTRKSRICLDGRDSNPAPMRPGKYRSTRRTARHKTISATISHGVLCRFTTQCSDAYTTLPIPSPSRRNFVLVSSSGARA